VSEPRFGRRRLLLLGASGLALACDSRRPHRGFLGVMERVNEAAQRALFNPDRTAPELTARELSPPGAFPPYFISPSVPLAPEGWALRVGGQVARPLTLSVADLMRLPRTDIRVRHFCVEGWSAVASWHGVQLREVARLVGADPSAGYVEFRSFDGGYFSSWDRASALHPQSVLAFGMNGEPLTPDHGAPLRFYSPVKLGYKGVKYLTDVLFLDQRTGGYWEDQGYEWFAGT
jgi:DMSO/TMAO reductase YedYZ molybdopterin-dependent catalytic subunit